MNIGTWTAALAVSLVMVCAPALGWCHVFPERSEPKVGATVTVAPAQVRIWFDGALEPAFSRIIVHDMAGKQIDRKDSRVNPADTRLLEVSLPALAPGHYHVEWRVVSRDGHRTTGDFSFVVK